MFKRKYSINLIEQMAECDANYIRLLKLVPQLRAYRGRSFLDQSFLQEFAQEMDPQQVTKLSKYQDEPEKILEGLSTKFCIADLAADDVSEGQDSESHNPGFKAFGSKASGSRQRVIVEIKIVEAFKYTTTLEISQQPQLRKWMTNPSMLVRVYHDASTAEVVSYQGHRNLKPKYSQPNPRMYHADEKKQVNKFLGEWLTHCLKVGRSLDIPTFST